MSIFCTRASGKFRQVRTWMRGSYLESEDHSAHRCFQPSKSRTFSTRRSHWVIQTRRTASSSSFKDVSMYWNIFTQSRTSMVLSGRASISYPPQVKLFECRMEKLLQLLRQHRHDSVITLKLSSDLLKVDVNGVNTTPPLRLHRARRAELVSIDSEAVRQVFTFAMSPLSLPVLLEPLPFFKALTPDWLGYEQMQLEFMLLFGGLREAPAFCAASLLFTIVFKFLPIESVHWQPFHVTWSKSLPILTSSALIIYSKLWEVASSARTRIHLCMYASTSSEIDGSTKLVIQVYDGPWRLRRLPQVLLVLLKKK